MTEEQLPQIASVAALDVATLELTWRGGRVACVDMAALFDAASGGRDARRARLDEWGHHLAWPDGTEIGADRLWLASLGAWGEEDARAFLEWRLRHGLSAVRAAEALGLRRADVIAYSLGTRPVPRAVILACRGWEALLPAA